MKKLFFFFAAMLVAITVNATTWNITNSDEGNLRRCLRDNAQAGDTVVLADGEYAEDQSYNIRKAVVIMAADGAKPVINQKSYLNLYASAKIIGIKFKYVGTSDGYCIYFRENSEKYLALEGCEFQDFTDYAFTSWDKFHIDSCIVNNCYFHDFAKGAFYFPKSTLANDTNACDKLKVTNSTFANITLSSVAVLDLRNNNNNSKATSELTVDHCTFYKCRGYERMIQTYKTPKGSVTNCIMMNPLDADTVSPTYATYLYGGEVKNCLTYQTKGHRDWDTHPTITNCSDADPLFKDAANADYTLGASSPALTAGTDGKAIGDPRWVPQTLYLKPGIWNVDGAKFAIWDITHSAWSEFMTPVENEIDFYTTTIPGDATQVIFVRLNSSATAPNWDKKDNQTEDLALVEGKDLFTITSWNEGQDGKSTGAWSLFEPTPWVDGSNNKLKVFKDSNVPSVVNVQKPGWAAESGIYMTFPSAAWDKEKFSLPESKYATEGAGMVIYLSALDLKYNEITVNCQNTNYTFTIYNVDGAETVYNVAGSSAAAFGTTWDTYANKMTLNEGLYTWEETELELAAGEITFKVVKDHVWAKGAWPNDNYVLNIPASGIYTIAISFNPDSKAITATATKTGEAVILPPVDVKGDWDDWAAALDMTPATDKKSCSVTRTFDVTGTYQFGIEVNGSWKSNGQECTFSRTNDSLEISGYSGNMNLDIDVAGEYTFTWYYETSVLKVTYPALPILYAEYATGHEGKADFADANGRILLTLRKSGNDIVVTVKNNNAAGNPQTGLNYLWVNATGATNNNATYGSHDTENTEEVSVTVKFDAAKDTYVFNNIHWAYAGFGGEWAIDGLTVKASELCNLNNGWYLVGTFNGEEEWGVENLTPAKKFAVNPDNTDEFVVAANLKKNDRFKAVYVYQDEIQADSWKPSDGDGYVVTDWTAGEKDIYFRVNYYNTWGGHFYIAPNAPVVTYHDFEIDLRGGQLGTDKENPNNRYLTIDGETYNYAAEMPYRYNAYLTNDKYNGSQHGYTNLVATIPVGVGNYKITLGTCQFGTGTGSVTNEDGSETLKTFNQKTAACYNGDANVVSVVVKSEAAQTIKVVCGNFTPYIKVEQIATMEYAVTFVKEEGEGILPADQMIVDGESLTIPVNQTLYKEGYTLTGWNDGTKTWAAGEVLTPTDDVTLTAVFTENAANLLTATSIVTVKWFFGTSNNAPALNLQGAQGFIVTQATIGESKVDVKLAIDATSGKCSNAGRADEWAQVNAGTTFSFPSKKGITVNVRAYSEPKESTLDGNGYTAWASNVATFSSESTAGTSVLVDGTDTYFSYLQVTYPASSATAIDNANANAKAVKSIVNGQLLITRDGKTYNVLGTQVK